MKTTFLTFASVLALSLAAQAQESDETTQQQATGESSECLRDLEELAQHMEDEGYWLAGYPGRTTGGYGTRYPYSPTDSAATRSAAPDADTATDPALGLADPWTDVRWQQRPQYELGTLFRAADVLARNGNEQACKTVVQATEEQYAEFSEQLRELGVEPGEIASWRQAQLAAAKPVSETGYPHRIDDIVGSDLRNARDQDLGQIEDVMLRTEEGAIGYAVVSTGGFFGIGGEDVIVPWEHLQVTPRGSFLLPVEQAALEQAPKAGGDIDPQQTRSIDRSEIDTYWNDALNEADAAN